MSDWTDDLQEENERLKAEVERLNTRVAVLEDTRDEYLAVINYIIAYENRDFQKAKAVAEERLAKWRARGGGRESGESEDGPSAHREVKAPSKRPVAAANPAAPCEFCGQPEHKDDSECPAWNPAVRKEASVVSEAGRQRTADEKEATP